MGVRAAGLFQQGAVKEACACWAEATALDPSSSRYSEPIHPYFCVPDTSAAIRVVSVWLRWL